MQAEDMHNRLVTSTMGPIHHTCEGMRKANELYGEIQMARPDYNPGLPPWITHFYAMDGENVGFFGIELWRPGEQYYPDIACHFTHCPWCGGKL